MKTNQFYFLVYFTVIICIIAYKKFSNKFTTVPTKEELEFLEKANQNFENSEPTANNPEQSSSIQKPPGLAGKVSNLASRISEAPNLAVAQPKPKQTMKDILSLTSKCITEDLEKISENEIWATMWQTVERCSSFYRKKDYDFSISGSDKMFLNLNDMYSNGCVYVTLRVGNDIGQEEKIKQAYPECEFFGADPYRNTGVIFEKFGTIFESAIDLKTGTELINVLLKAADGGDSYGWRSLNTTSLAKFLTEHVRKKTIHFLAMDIEGSEYRIMSSPQSFEDMAVNICQISIMMHGLPGSYNLTDSQFGSIVKNFYEKSPFVPVRAVPPQYHQRLTLVNYKSDECRRALFGLY